ncbi:MAG: hypothetical protein R3E56_07935 [Burkholderiaceae bacterium]
MLRLLCIRNHAQAQWAVYDVEVNKANGIQVLPFVCVNHSLTELLAITLGQFRPRCETHPSNITFFPKINGSRIEFVAI